MKMFSHLNAVQTLSGVPTALVKAHLSLSSTQIPTPFITPLKPTNILTVTIIRDAKDIQQHYSP